MRMKYLGWVLFIIGCLALLNSLILLNFLMNWMPSWFISLALIGIGAWLLRLKIRSIFGVLFGLLAVAGIVYCIISLSTAGILGIIIFAILSWVLLRKGLFRESVSQTPGASSSKVQLEGMLRLALQSAGFRSCLLLTVIIRGQAVGAYVCLRGDNHDNRDILASY